MAFQPVANAATAFVQCTCNGVNVGFTLNFFRAAGYVQADLDNLASAVDQWMGTEMLPLLSNNLTYVGTEVRGLENEEDLTSFDDDSTGAGGVVADPSPNNVTFCVKRLSGFTGRSARGRVYLPGIPRTFLDGVNENFVTSAAAANWVDALLAVLSYVITHGWIEIIISRWNEGMKRSEGVSFGITDWTNSDLRVDTMRRRLPAV